MLRFTDIIIACVITFVSFASYAHNTELTHVRVCGDAIDWSPYTYVVNDAAYGSDVVILDRVLVQNGVSYDITMTSWSRCLRGTKSGEFDLALSASFSDTRTKDFLYTEWYYSITPYYIYSSTRFPQGLEITSVQDLSAYKVCGNHGYNYADFELNNIVREGNSVKDVLTKLRQGECEVYLNWLEIIDGLKSVWGIEYITDDLVAKAIPNMPPHKFYMLISKQFPAQTKLKQVLDNYLISLQGNQTAP
ncbi:MULTISPECIES: substrate-binding periplasmic protein [unclassified Vibrio]|uniref:substrate-binding periplasmic protein n=1 Tax=unclassified Vibrio TaxID=2614977 RepID=UPI002F409B7E